MRKELIIGLCIIFTVFINDSIARADAVVLRDSIGITGIQSLEVEGVGTFNIDFMWATFNDIFDSGLVFLNFDETDAGDVVGAINTVLNNALVKEEETVVVNNLIHPLGWNGTSNFYYLPYQIDEENVYYIYNPRNISYEYNVNGQGSDILTSFTVTYAIASSVPIPGAIWLLGSGLIGIVGIRRKFKN